MWSQVRLFTPVSPATAYGKLTVVGFGPTLRQLLRRSGSFGSEEFMTCRCPCWTPLERAAALSLDPDAPNGLDQFHRSSRIEAVPARRFGGALGMVMLVAWGLCDGS
jgi:hypothetical protein